MGESAQLQRGRDMIWLLRSLIVAGLGLVSLAIWEQPLMADDWYLLWDRADAGSCWAFVAQYYQGWGGRVLLFFISGIALSSDIARKVSQLLTVPCFLLFSAFAYYLSTGTFPRLGRTEGRHWLLFAAVLWLGAPMVSENIVQTTGSSGYLWPAAAGLALLCLFRNARDRAQQGEIAAGGWVPRVGLLLAGIVVGTGNEQLFAGMAVVLAGWGWMLWQSGRLRYLPGEAWFGLAGLILGAIIQVAAPGNYVRLGQPQNEGVAILSMLVRYGMYLGGADFGLGTGDAGRALWLGIAVIALGGVFAANGDRGKDAGIWVAGSLATLAPMLPLVNFAAPRTTFLPATFLVIAVLTAFPRKPDSDKPSAASWLVAFSMAMLVVIDGLVGWAANRALAGEMAARVEIVQAAAAEGRSEVVVPYLATVPSRLTAMLNPEQDAEFVGKLASHYGLVNGRHDDSATAPRPNTLNTLKALKNSF